MFKTIVVREILEYLKSARFVLGLIITVVLVAASTLINVQDYVLRHQDYLDAKKELQAERRRVNILREPQVLSTLVRGKDKDLGERVRIWVGDVPSELSGTMNVRKPKFPSLARLSAVDFAFLVRVVMSLMVIFLAYGAVAEEKAGGTLKLVLANALPRDKLLLGKLVSGLAVVLGALAVASLLAVIFLMLHPAVSLSGSDILRIAGMMAVSALYLSVFYTLGLFVSVKVDRPAVALMVLLQAWVFLVVIYPNVSVVLAERLAPLPSEQTVAAERAAVEDRFRDALREVNERLADLSDEKKAAENRLRFNQVWSQNAEEVHEVDMEFSRRQTRQMRAAELVSSLSPAALYDQVMNRQARTDIREYERFMEGAVRLWRSYVERDNLRVTDYEAYKKSTLPEFGYASDPAAQSLAAVWPQGLILVLYSLIFFTLAYTGFLRKDLR
jgi:ABC-type transport system involved in multi-copper enzyme maturation permease subunit